MDTNMSEYNYNFYESTMLDIACKALAISFDLDKKTREKLLKIAKDIISGLSEMNSIIKELEKEAE